MEHSVIHSIFPELDGDKKSRNTNFDQKINGFPKFALKPIQRPKNVPIFFVGGGSLFDKLQKVERFECPGDVTTWQWENNGMPKKIQRIIIIFPDLEILG
jgi:hypothetical protein